MHALPCRFVESSVGYLAGLASTAELVPIVRQHRDRMLTNVMLDTVNHLAVISTQICANVPCNREGFMSQSSNDLAGYQLLSNASTLSKGSTVDTSAMLCSSAYSLVACR